MINTNIKYLNIKDNDININKLHSLYDTLKNNHSLLILKINNTTTILNLKDIILHDLKNQILNETLQNEILKIIIILNNED